MNKEYISIVERTDSVLHRSKIIIHKRNGFYFAEFSDEEQFIFFCKTLGITFEKIEEINHVTLGKYIKYELCQTIEEMLFWKTRDLPDDAKPIKALSNGSIVTCYYVNDGKTIKFYRPNPNAKSVYKPLDVNQTILHKQVYGLY